MIGSIAVLSVLVLASTVCSEVPFERSQLTSESAEIREGAMSALITRVATLSEVDRELLSEIVLDSEVSTEIRISAAEGIRYSVTAVFGETQPGLSEHISSVMWRVVDDSKNDAELRSYCLCCLFLAIDSSEHGEILERKVLNMLGKDQPNVVKRTILTMPRMQPLRSGRATYKVFDDVLKRADESEEIRLKMIESLHAMASVNLLTAEDFGGLMDSALTTQACSDEFRRTVFDNEALLRLPRQIPLTPKWVKRAMTYDFLHRNCSPEYMEYILDELTKEPDTYPDILLKAIDIFLDKSVALPIRRKTLHVMRSVDVDDAKVIDLLDLALSRRASIDDEAAKPQGGPD